MATYYVRKTGSNSNGGTSAGAAWQTIAKALTSTTAGDTVYVGAGVYRETMSLAQTNASDITFVGDYNGKNTGDVGEIQITNYTTNDKTAGSTRLMSTTVTAASHYAFQNITFVAGNAGLFLNNSSVSATFMTFTDCTFLNAYSNGADGFFITQGVGQYTYNWTFDRCRFLYTIGSSNYLFNISALQPSVADTDIQFTVQNCMFSGTAGSLFNVTSNAGGYGNLPGGIVFKNNTVLGGKVVFTTSASNWSTVNPIRVYSNNMVANQFANVGTSGQLVEDYNFYWTNTGTLNVSTGANTKVNGAYSLMGEWGQELVVGKLLRPFGTPTIDSPALGYGSNGSYTTSVDILNKARPSGGAVTWASASKSVGCYERHDFGTKDTVTYDTGPTSLKMTGPGDQFLQIPVDALSTTITIRTRWDSSYGGGTLPTFTLLANGEIGVLSQSVTAVGSANTWVTVSLSAFTPTATGVVTVGLVSNSAAAGTCNWDNITVTAAAANAFSHTPTGGLGVSGLAGVRIFGAAGTLSLSGANSDASFTSSGGSIGANTFNSYFQTAADDGSGGTVTWANTGNCVGSFPSDNVYTTATVGSGSVTHYLNATNPQTFSVIGTPTFTGIVIGIERKTSISGPIDVTVQLIKGGVRTGTNKSAGASWSTTESVVNFGAGNDLWGSTWTQSDFGSSFGVSIQASNAGSAATLSIDSVQVTLYYDTSGGAIG